MPTNLTAGKELIGLSRCPRCGIATPQMRHACATDDPVRPNDARWKGLVWATYCCSTCGGGVLVSVDPEFQEIVEIYPDQQQAHEDIPEPARNYLQQAMETLHAPDAAAVMAGSAVDAMLKQLDLTEGSLYSRIDKAVAEHRITAPMGDWAHEVRFGSNRPRHSDNERPHVTPEEAKQSVQFAEALGNFLFVLTAKIRRGTDAAKMASASDSE
jgi:hypothetical protein